MRESYFSPLFGPWKTASGVLRLVLDFPVYQRHCCTGVSPTEGYQQHNGAHVVWAEAEGTGFDQPEEEMANRKSYCSLHLPSGKIRRRWSLILLGGVQWRGNKHQVQHRKWHTRKKKITMRVVQRQFLVC